MSDFEGLLNALVASGVEFILVGGLAARAHGAARSTQDVDVVYARSASSPRRWLTISAVRPAIHARTRSQMSPSAAGSTP